MPLSLHTFCRAELSASDRSGFVAALQGIRNAAALANASIPLPLVPQLANATVEYAARLTLVSAEYASIRPFPSFCFHHTPSDPPDTVDTLTPQLLIPVGALSACRAASRHFTAGLRSRHTAFSRQQRSSSRT